MVDRYIVNVVAFAVVGSSPIPFLLSSFGEIGRRSGFKIHRSQEHPGSSPGAGSNFFIFLWTRTPTIS